MTAGRPIALRKVCRGSPTKLSVVAAYFDEVMAVCGNGGDGFDTIVEPHGKTWGVTPVDYYWDPTPMGTHTPNEIVMQDVVIWSGPNPGELYALQDNRRVDWYRTSVCLLRMDSNFILPAAVWGSGEASKSLTIHKEARGDTTWGAISSAGNYGLLSVH